MGGVWFSIMDDDVDPYQHSILLFVKFTGRCANALVDIAWRGGLVADLEHHSNRFYPGNYLPLRLLLPVTA